MQSSIFWTFEASARCELNHRYDGIARRPNLTPIYCSLCKLWSKETQMERSRVKGPELGLQTTNGHDRSHCTWNHTVNTHAAKLVVTIFIITSNDFFSLSNKFSFQHFHSKFELWTWGHWFKNLSFWAGVSPHVFCTNSESLVWKQTKFDVIFKWLSYQLHVSKAEQDTLTEIYVQNY